jgi:hypothetical protein
MITDLQEKRPLLWAKVASAIKQEPDRIFVVLNDDSFVSTIKREELPSSMNLFVDQVMYMHDTRKSGQTILAIEEQHGMDLFYCARIRLI